MIDARIPRAIVGITENGERLAGFYGDNALVTAEKYVGTLDHADDGRYYIDYPCNEVA